LPLPRWGSSGITVNHTEALLDAAVAAVPAPPLHDTSRTALYGWLRDVQAGLVSRREQLWMARRVTEAFHAERSSAEAIERTRRAVRQHEDIAEMRQAGTWGQQPLLINIATAAELLALSRSTIYELIWQGELQPIHIGRSVRLTHDELQSFVARQVARADQPT
jgi:excisionase family DNA binding protein